MYHFRYKVYTTDNPHLRRTTINRGEQNMQLEGAVVAGDADGEKWGAHYERRSMNVKNVVASFKVRIASQTDEPVSQLSFELL